MPAARATIMAVMALAALRVDAAAPAWLAPITQTAQPFVGVTHYQITQSVNLPTPYLLPRELSIQIVEIDPTAPGISFLGTPGNGGTAEEYTRQTTSQFVTSQGLAVGINGDFYSTDTGGNASVNGLGMSNGSIISTAASGTYSLVTRQNNTAVIPTTTQLPSGAWNAVSGNQLILRNGVNVAPNNSYTTTLNPHTAAGIDKSNGHIFFMVVDGRQTDFSEGMRTDDMALLLGDFGVDDAINLDGGGSTTLVFAEGAQGAARTVNSPSDGSSGQHAGGERSVANHFGVFATPNPGYTPLAAPQRPQAAAPDPLLPSVTILDGFGGDEGRFTSTPYSASGSTNGITSASTAVYTPAEAHAGAGSQQITMVRDSSSTARLRHLSGGGRPVDNRVSVGAELRAMGPQGFVGFLLKTTESDLQVGIGIDDGASAGSTGLEVSSSLPVIADGKWHLYEWNLGDAAQWSNFSGGNGSIGGPNAYIDSLFVYAGASTAGRSLTMFVDTVAYNPHGSLAELATNYTADFSGDWLVDGVDFSQWLGDFGLNADSDADDDGDSDGADFMAWQRQFGNRVQATAASTAVAEPGALALAAMAVAVLRICRGNARSASDFVSR